MATKSWNHITSSTVRQKPIAVHVETKAPMKSWTDGKPQIATWCDTFLRRLDMFSRDGNDEATSARQSTAFKPPPIPLLIAQGHDWYLLIVSRDMSRTVIRDQIPVGGSRNVFEALKLVAVLQWCAQWAETQWRPAFERHVAGALGVSQ